MLYSLDEVQPLVNVQSHARIDSIFEELCDKDSASFECYGLLVCLL